VCDTFAALGSWTDSGQLIFAKNSDREFYEAQYFQSFPAQQFGRDEKLRMTYVEIDQAPEAKAVILSRPHWMWGAEMGANEDGLVVGNEALFANVPAGEEPGVIGMDLVRLALERTASVDEAIDLITRLLKKHGQSGNCGYKEKCVYHNSFLLLDTNGASVLETVDREWVVRDIADYDSISNVYTTCKNYRAASDSLGDYAFAKELATSPADVDFKGAFEDPKEADFGERRRARSRSLLKSANGELSLQDTFGILRDHGENGGEDYWEARLCLHMKGKFLDATTCSMVSSVSAEQQVHWVTGTAATCTSIFKPTVVGLDIPDHGPAPGENDDGQSLWWRHEALRNYLLAAEPDSDLIRTFEAERDALESTFIERMRQEHEDTASQVADCWREAMQFENAWIARATSAGYSASVNLDSDVA